MLRLFLSLPIVLTACLKDETISGYADQSATFHLTEINGTPFTASATITFPEKGQITGRAPCNKYSAVQSAPYPWFKLGPIRSTRATCSAMKQEAAFFEQLQKMTLIETFSATIILKNDSDDEMVFQAAQE